jgi:serine/threonine protein kinase
METPPSSPDWEAFYRDYRKPGYVPGFEITSKLGGGMFGLVFRARRMSIGKDYAIKFLQVDDGEVRKAVLSELSQVQYFAQIDHPNLVSIEDRGEVDGIPYLVMAFAGTETLRDKLPAGRVPTAAEKDELLRWFLQCCRGLSALHERALVHFDIKPANVFLKGQVARLGDYGLSKLVTHSRGSLSMGRGTPYYMAPEMLQRRGDHRSDIYSLGVLLYELLCGRVPFTGDSEWEVLKQHETKAPELPAHLTAAERAVLGRCLAKDPAARFQSVTDLLAALGQEADAPPRPTTVPSTARLPECVVAPFAGIAASEAPPARRRSVWRTAGIVLVVVAVTNTVLFTLSAERRDRAQLAYGGQRLLTQSQTRSTKQASSPSAQLQQRVQHVVQGALRLARSASQRERRPELATFDVAEFQAPKDQRSYAEMVQKLAKAPTFVSGQAQKVARYGRPTLLAAVEQLHGLDYDDENDRRAAGNLQRYLAHLTSIDALVADVGCDAESESDICRLLAVSDGWRKVVEQFARNDAGFQELLTTLRPKSGAER